MRMPNPAGSNPNLAALMRRYLWTAGVVALLATIIGLLEGMGVSLLIPLLSVVNGASPGSTPVESSQSSNTSPTDIALRRGYFVLLASSWLSSY